MCRLWSKINDHKWISKMNQMNEWSNESMIKNKSQHTDMLLNSKCNLIIKTESSID